MYNYLTGVRDIIVYVSVFGSHVLNITESFTELATHVEYILTVPIAKYRICVTLFFIYRVINYQSLLLNQYQIPYLYTIYR